MTQRKTIKVTIPSVKVDAFQKAKQRAENGAMIAMSDAQYATRLIQWALDMQDNGLVVVGKTPEGNIHVYVTGPHGSEQHEQACLASQLLEESWEGKPH